VGIDPWTDREDGRPHIEHLADNARAWRVRELVLGVQVGVPDTRFAGDLFDYVYSTTALEMIRGNEGEEAYRACLGEIFRVLRPNGVFGLGEPMHFDVDIPPDLVPLVTQGDYAWADCFATLDETLAAVNSVGFEIIEADYAPDAPLWWEEFARHDPFCKEHPDGDPRTIRLDGGRWLSFGYLIARKPS
jgi:SAM-dependent methyltransferase